MKDAHSQPKFGFTLAELLIALAVLGVIAVFTIPKVLQGQQNSQKITIAKETAGTISQVFQIYKSNNTLTTSTDFAAMTPYMNYVGVDSVSGVIDGGQTCDPIDPCLTLHNGAKLLYYPSNGFGGTTSLNAIKVVLDPDGVNNEPVSLDFYLYYDGKIRTAASREVNTVWAGSTYPAPGTDPTWFSWDN